MLLAAVGYLYIEPTDLFNAERHYIQLSSFQLQHWQQCHQPCVCLFCWILFLDSSWWSSVVKLLNQRWWIPVFRRNSNMTGDMYTCVSVTGKLYACIRIILHFWSTISQKRQTETNDLVPRAHATARWYLPAVYLMWSSFAEHWHWIHRTVRIPCLTLVDSNRKVPDLYFKVVYPKLPVADLKAEMGELRSVGIPPQFNPWWSFHVPCNLLRPSITAHSREYELAADAFESTVEAINASNRTSTDEIRSALS